jgi:hypothetical protein
MAGYKRYLHDQEMDESAEPDHPDSEDPKNYRKEKKMALGGNKKGKSDSKKGGSSKGGKKDNSAKRYVGSIWENEGRDGNFLSMSVDNLDPDSEYHKGNLIWFDKETEKYYKVKSMAVYNSDKGPKNLTNKLVLDLENEYHVEQIED